MRGDRRPMLRVLPAALFAVTAIGLAAIGLRIVAGERAVAERTARERLTSQAREGAGILVAAAAALARRAALGPADAVAGPDGAFSRPAPPRRIPKLPLDPGRDPEAAFYLACGERAEAVDADPDRAAELYRAAAAGDRDDTARRIALFRLAALHRRTGATGEAEREEADFLALVPPERRSTLEALIVRSRARPPDPELGPDLLRAIGSPDEPVALGLLAGAGLSDPASIAARREELTRIARLTPLLDGPGGDGCVILGGRLVAFVCPGDGRTLFAEAPLPDLPARVRIAGETEPGPDALVESVPAGPPLSGVTLLASTPAAEVRAGAGVSARRLAVALGALLLAGAAALLLTVRATRREAAAAREKAAFATRVGHDLRTPLALIRMYAETLADGRVEDPVQAREFAGIAAREAERLTELVGRVLDLSRVGEGTLSRRDLDLAALAREVAEAHRPLAERAGMRIVDRTGPPVPVTGDPAALRGAVANLLENAVRHAAAGGEVEIACEADGEEARLTVADRGPGIPEPIRDRLFERFVRGRDARAPGAGLGLALVREVAVAHGGTAEAEDREGGGAVLVMRLPVGRGSG